MERTIQYLIFSIYAIYFVLISIALNYCIKGELVPFIWLAPAITMSLHFLFMVSGFIFVKNYNPYPIKGNFQTISVITDIFMAISTFLSYIAYSYSSNSLLLATSINSIALFGNIVCFYKTYSLLKNNRI